MISAARAGVDRDYLSQARAKGPEKESRRSQIDLKGTATSKSKASRGGEAGAREEERRERREKAPVTPPSPPHWSRRQEGSSKGKGKWKTAKGKAEIEDGTKRKKKNKGLKRGVWWEGYLQSRATRKAQRTGEEVAVEEESEAVEEVEAVEESSGAELALSERLARWSDAPEEAGSQKASSAKAGGLLGWCG